MRRLFIKNLKSSFVTLKHGDDEVVRVSIEGYPYLAYGHMIVNRISYALNHGIRMVIFEKETPDFYHREGTMILKPNEEWTCSYWIEVL